jgi:Uma2 family endonuclease
MQEYRRLGVQLGSLINPQNQQVEIYRPTQETEVLTLPNKIDCDEVMPGFVLDLTHIW